MFEDVKAINKNDPSAGGMRFVLYPGLLAIVIYRYLSHPLYIIKMKFLAYFFCQLARFLTQVEIHPGAKIGRGLFIDHGNGVVIGETAEIGKNCVIFHGVTFGGTGNHTGKRHPSVGDNVFIGTGAALLGPINVGDNVKIGAKSVIIMHDVPSDCTVVGSPAKIVKLHGDIVNMRLKRTHIDEVEVKEVPMQVLHNVEKEKKTSCRKKCL